MDKHLYPPRPQTADAMTSEGAAMKESARTDMMRANLSDLTAAETRQMVHKLRCRILALECDLAQRGEEDARRGVHEAHEVLKAASKRYSEAARAAFGEGAPMGGIAEPRHSFQS